MMLRVRERGDEVHIDVDGVAGRQQRVLQALTECQRLTYGSQSTSTLPLDVSVRSGANTMRIRLKGKNGLRFEPSAVYRCLREALVARTPPAGAIHPAP